MSKISELMDCYTSLMQRMAMPLNGWFLPHLARFVFAAVLAGYYWSSALTKFGEGFFGFLQPTTGAYYQILPTITEAVGYDTTQINIFYTAIVLLGSWAEVILPLLIILGLFTRGAALAMIGFIIVQSLTDIFGHRADAATIGSWFDRFVDAPVLDQRLFWITILLVLIIKGAGRLSLDHALGIEKQ